MVAIEKKYWLIFGLLVAAILCRYTLDPGSGMPPVDLELRGVPYQVNGWRGVDQELDQEVIDILGLDAFVQRRYLDQDGRSLWLYIGYYRQQRQGKGIHSPKHCYPGAGWSIMEKGVERIPLDGAGNRSIQVNRILFQKEGAKQVVLYWFQSYNRIVHSEYTQRIYMVLDAVWHNRTDGALIKVSAPVIGDLGEVMDRQKRFIRSIYPDLERELSGRE
jgi:EpsI family protein